MAYHGNVHGNVHGNDGNVQNDSLHKAFQRSCMFPPTCNCSSRMLNSSCSSSSCRNPIASGADLILQHYIAKSHEFNQALKVGEKDPQSLIEMLEPILELQETCMMLLHRAQEQPLMQNKIILIQQRSDTLGRMGIDGKIEGAQAWIMNTSGSSDESDIEEGKPKKPGKVPEIVGVDSHLKFTEMCKFHLKKKCTKGKFCTFAHNQKDLLKKPDLMRTQICEMFKKGECSEGSACKFAHNHNELRTLPTSPPEPMQRR
eukprot:TRINITY_DN24576_c0_g1_i1.p1 TRINITY_DN24576_c0_g1~~TRINITY_DN24576_c0_g1_i1.p1  ORF type:complete len:258 (+),score=43.85 TRINITY_DN24576_c0_g1_i1:72-845(+)